MIASGSICADMSVHLKDAAPGGERAKVNATVTESDDIGRYIVLRVGEILTIFPDPQGAREIIDALTAGLKELEDLEAAEANAEHGVPDSEREVFGCDTEREYQELGS